VEPNEEILINIEPGKNILVRFLNISEPDAEGNRVAYFKLNGQTRAVEVRDTNVKSTVVAHQKAIEDNEVGAPLQGSLSKLLVKEGDEVAVNDPLFIIEAMKMESTITAPVAGKVKRIHLKEKTIVHQDDLVVEIAE